MNGTGFLTWMTSNCSDCWCGDSLNFFGNWGDSLILVGDSSSGIYMTVLTTIFGWYKLLFISFLNPVSRDSCSRSLWLRSYVSFWFPDMLKGVTWFLEYCPNGDLLFSILRDSCLCCKSLRWGLGSANWKFNSVFWASCIF